MTNSVNQITGSYLSSKLGTREDMARYAQGWDRIFGAKKEVGEAPQPTPMTDITFKRKMNT